MRLFCVTPAAPSKARSLSLAMAPSHAAGVGFSKGDMPTGAPLCSTGTCGLPFLVFGNFSSMQCVFVSRSNTTIAPTGGGTGVADEEEDEDEEDEEEEEEEVALALAPPLFFLG